MTRARSAALLEPMNLQQRSRYHTLADAIEEALDVGRSVPCVKYPELFDEPRRRRDRDYLCLRCPVLKQCRSYVETGVSLSGYAAGGSL